MSPVLQNSRTLSIYEIDGIGATKEGCTGGGDSHFTEGRALVGMLETNSGRTLKYPLGASIVVIEPPVDVAAKRTLRGENTRSQRSHKLSSRHFSDEGSALQCSGAMLQSEKV